MPRNKYTLMLVIRWLFWPLNRLTGPDNSILEERVHNICYIIIDIYVDIIMGNILIYSLNHCPRAGGVSQKEVTESKGLIDLDQGRYQSGKIVKKNRMNKTKHLKAGSVVISDIQYRQHSFGSNRV